MTPIKERKLGTSLCFSREISDEAFGRLAAAGIGCIEYSFGYNHYMNVLEYPAHATKYSNIARRAGLENWSIHLPFSGRLDISNPNNELRDVTIYTNKTLIRAAGRAGVKVAVLHPSSEPIAEEDRPMRLERSRAAIEILKAECDKAGMLLAVENLPRTCLCRTSDEMIKLLSGTGAGVVFDTNHCLAEDNIHYVKAVAAAGIPFYSVHISDYFRDENGVLDERHVLPGEGINKWPELLAALADAGYEGPLMYEVPSKPKTKTEPITVEELADNMKRLRDGKI